MTKLRTAVIGLVAPGLALAIVPAVLVAGDGAVAITTADPACGDDSGAIYVDCGNGTVTDNRTGLVWLAAADCWGEVTWPEAVRITANLGDVPDTSAAAADDCGLSDGSLPGDWRLPTLGEFEAMVADALACTPTITDDAGSGCWMEGVGTSFTGIQSDFYWSASVLSSTPANAWAINLGNAGMAASGPQTAIHDVWAVRTSQ